MIAEVECHDVVIDGAEVSAQDEGVNGGVSGKGGMLGVVDAVESGGIVNGDLRLGNLRVVVDRQRDKCVVRLLPDAVNVAIDPDRAKPLGAGGH